MRRFLAIALAVTLIGTLAAACGGGGGSKTIDVPGAGKVTLSGNLPSDFPSDFPVYKGASLQGSYKGTQEGITGYIVSWETGDSADKVKSFYDDAFGSGPWKSTSSGNAGGTAFWSADNSGSNKTAWVGATDSSGKTMIVVAIGDKESASSADNTPQADDTATPTKGSSTQKTPTAAPEATVTSPLPAEVTLSKDFPADRVPFPSGARVTSDSSYSSGGQKTFLAEIYVKQSAADLNDYFKGELPKHDWTETLTTSQNGEFMLMYSGQTDESVVVSIKDSDTPGYATASIIVTVASS